MPPGGSPGRRTDDEGCKDEGHCAPPTGATQVGNKPEYVEFEIYYARLKKIKDLRKRNVLL